MLVTRKNEPIKNEEKFIVGTGSLRRRGFIKKQYPLVQIKDIRGNVDTRINKLINNFFNISSPKTLYKLPKHIILY